MTVSSKKQAEQIDLLVRVGVLEKLFERLSNTVDELKVKVDSVLSSPHIPSVKEEEDEWEINNELGTVEKKKGEPELLKDDVSNILDS